MSFLTKIFIKGAAKLLERKTKREMVAQEKNMEERGVAVNSLLRKAKEDEMDNKAKLHPKRGIPKGHQEVEYTEVIEPPEGGRFQRIKGETHLLPARPTTESLIALETAKRMLPAFIDYYHNLLQKHFLEPKKYSRPVRELYRWFNESLIAREGSAQLKERWPKIRDLLCWAMEGDTAYRWRAQITVPELNMDEIKPTEADLYYFSKNKDWKHDFKKQS